MRERTVSVRGLPLTLCEWGPSDGPTIVCLHGWMEHGGFWWRVAEPLAEEGFHVIAPDARGHGRSGHAGVGGYYHFSDYLVDLDGLVDTPVHLVGHSMGGTVASMFAAARPHKVRTLTLSEGLGPPSETTPQAVDRIRKHLDHMQRDWSHPEVSLEDAAARLVRTWPALDIASARVLAARQHDGSRWVFDPLHKSRSPIAFHLDRHLEQLRRIACPVALLFGKRSWYSGIDRLQERITSVRPKQTVQAEAGHAIHLEAPGQIVRILRQFATRNAANSH